MDIASSCLDEFLINERMYIRSIISDDKDIIPIFKTNAGFAPISLIEIHEKKLKTFKVQPATSCRCTTEIAFKKADRKVPRAATENTSPTKIESNLNLTSLKLS